MLVEADHGDIIGHFRQQQDGYDVLRSATTPPFTEAEFAAVWRDVKRFALSGDRSEEVAG